MRQLDKTITIGQNDDYWMDYWTGRTIGRTIGQDGLLDKLDYWTRWIIGRDGLLDKLDYWTRWIIGRDGLLDKTDYWTRRQLLKMTVRQQEDLTRRRLEQWTK
jgi:hypothetical protein